MEMPKDIPPLKDLKNGTIIEVQTKQGIMPLSVWQVDRVTGHEKCCISIRGFMRMEPPLRTQCYVSFMGTEIGSQFTRASKHKQIWEVTLETIVSKPEFWGESQ
jgi:hypothetical protein